jgi:two-component system NtrC family response regulator
MLPEDDPEAVLVELWIKWAEGHYAEVVAETQRFIEIYSAELHPLLGEFLFIRGNANSRLGRLQEALEDCGTAYSFFKVLQKMEQQAEVCNVTGRILLELARYAEALRWFHESLDINQALELPRRAGDNCLNIGIAYYKEGDSTEALRFLNRAIAASDTTDSPHLLCRAKIALANVYRMQHHFEDARANLLAAYTLATDRRLPREECLALEFLGDVLRDEGKPQEARRYYARGMAIAQRIAPEGDLVMELKRRDGECLLLMDQPEASLPVLHAARAQAAQLGDPFEESVIQRCLAQALAKLSRWEAARQHIGEALARLASIHARYEEAITYLSGARICLAQAQSQGHKRFPRQLMEDALAQAVAADRRFQRLGLDFWSQQARQVLAELVRRQWGPNKGESTAVRGTPELSAETDSEVIAVSAQMRAALQQCEIYARFDEAILITGDTGTGKDLLARRIHDLSPRRVRPFVAVNCAAIPATLFEREFFGHRRGAYSGADKDSPGFVAQAEGGTLFLDEIGELPWELQAKLLRLLQDGSYVRLGDPQEYKANVRLIAATNADLDSLVAEGGFRQDLSYRLKALQIALAPLRERSDDILPLLNHFLSKFSGRPVSVWDFFDEQSVLTLRRYRWPGNVRELIMVARRAQISKEAEGRTNVLLGSGAEVQQLSGRAVSQAMGNSSRERLLRVLDETSGNKAEAARQLGVARQTLYRWLKRHGIED